MIIHDLSHTTMRKGIEPGTLLIPLKHGNTMYIALVVVTTQELIVITWLSEESQTFQTTYCL